MESDMISRIMTKYFGNEYSVADKELLFYRMNSVGCGYIAAINIIMEDYLSKYDELEFCETFGFPPYTLKNDPDTGKLFKDFNYEYLFLDFFLYYGINERGFTTIEEILGNTEEEIEWRNGHAGDGALDDTNFVQEGMTGTRLKEVSNVVKKYLAEKGISVSGGKIKLSAGSDEWKILAKELGVTDNFNDDLIIAADKLKPEKIQKILNSGDKIIIGLNDFTLFLPYDKDGNGKLDDVYKDGVGSHAMAVVGTTDDGKIIVSSWGKPYIINLNIDTLRDYWIYNFEY